MEKITLGSGCFWCTEAIFRNLKGVESAVSGYSGGKTKDPFYKEVCSGTTGHAEVVQVTFDPAVISLTEILEVFWKMHDPTTLNRQGNDVGTQYRSVVFYHDDQQKEVAETIRVELTKAKIWNDSIVTEISPISMFYTAENYHQDYLASHGSEPYCQFVVTPKVKKFKEIFADKLK
jgi:peptide-methionine (S)-S-oxide reductase